MTEDEIQNRIATERLDYSVGEFGESDLLDDPIDLFKVWYARAVESGIAEPNAMTLATVDLAGSPDARMVLLRGADAEGFTFFTNFGSVKGRELAAHPRAALVFYWQALNRQVRVQGRVERVAEEESAAYFHSRPHRSQLAAWASAQSSVLASREPLEEAMRELEARYQDGDTVPLPEFWGGYRVVPDTIEFWQGRRSRLHDRFRYSQTPEGWIVERLSP